jgi:8-oxo-dGTP pyrophosphatase MutT (NUDIX family)
VIRRTHVEVYPFRRRAGRVEFLCLRRAPGGWLPGAWQPVTGRIRRGETALAAAVREVREETGLAPRRWWALETVTVYFDPAADVVHALPLFAAEVDARTAVRLSREHTGMAWLPARAAGARFVWEAQRTGLAAVRREVLRGGRLAAALECTARARGSTAAARRPRRRAAKS